MLTMYVIANGDLVREGLNALVTFLGENSFGSLTRIVTTFGIYGVILAFIKHRDVTEMIKWFAMMVFFSSVMIAPKTELAIYDSSSPGSALEVDNVPVSLALIASTFTSMSYGVTTAIETAFHLPDELQYSKTGMLFGSKLFQASHDFRILDPDLHAEMNSYVQNCILGDIKINQKYTYAELKESESLWDTTSQSPSPVRRMTLANGTTLSCVDAKPVLYQNLTQYINDNAFVLYGKKLFGTNSQSYENLFNQYLSPSYNFLLGGSQTASNIFMQAILINAMKEGIRDYASLSDATAGLQDYAMTKSEIQTESTWAVTAMEASYFLPLIQTLLLLILICLFPFVAVLSLLPSGFSQWGNYLRSFAYLGLWPPLFGVINMAMNYYVESHTSVFTGISMNNFDTLTQMNYSTAAIAGYLSLSVPFLSYGLVSNRLLHAIGAPVNQLLSGLQGSVSQATMETTTGNMGLGNASYRNFSGQNMNMNKHDTDITDFHGTYTEQMSSGVMKTTTENGQAVYNVSPGLSNIAQSLNLGSQLSQTLSQSAETARQTALTESDNVQSSISHASSRFLQLGNSLSHDDRDNDHVSSGLSASENRALSFLDSKADEISKNEHISKSEAYKILGTMAYSGHVGGGLDTGGAVAQITKIPVGAKANIGVDVSYAKNNVSEHIDTYNRSDTHGLTSREAQEVSQAFHTIASHQSTQSNDVSDSRSRALVDNLASDLRQAETSSHNRDVSFSQSERLSTMATTAQSQSASVNSNLNQAFVNYVRAQEGDAYADSLFSNPGALSSQAQLNTLAQSFVHQEASSMMKGEAQDFMSTVNPEQMYHQRAATQQGVTSNLLKANQEANESILNEKRNFQTTNGVKNEIRENVSQNLNAAEARVSSQVINQSWQEHQQEKAKMEDALDKGSIEATQWTLPVSRDYLDGHKRVDAVKIEQHNK